MKAVILAAGKGSRLTPFTDIIPKPLMPIGINSEGRFLTIIEKLISQIKEAGIIDIVIIVNFKADLIMNYLKEDAGMGVHLTYLVQSTLDGNAGAFYRAQHLIDSDVLISDCDNFIEDREIIKKMVEYHKKEKNVLTVGVCPVEEISKFAIIKCDEKNRPIDIFEKPTDRKVWGNLAKSGILILSKNLAMENKKIALTEENEYTTTKIVQAVIKKGLRLGLFYFKDGFNDIGTWPEYISVLRKSL